MLSEALYAYLIGDAGLQALLGTTDTRVDETTGVFPLVAPEESDDPWVVFQQVSGAPAISMDGTNRYSTSRWRMSCYSSTYKKAKELTVALKAAMSGFDGVHATQGVTVEGTWQVIEHDDMEEMPHGTIYAAHVDYTINFADDGE